MSKKMLINATLPEEDRVAIVDDGILTELDIEVAERQQTKSNIYKGEVVRVEQGLQAAFIDYGAGRPGFLQIGDIHSSLYPKQEDGTPVTGRLSITQILSRGQQILVQVVKEERGNKGAALTTEISLPGRYMVLMPESDSRGISRKIDDDATRKGIKQSIAGLDLPANMGYIIRTAAIDQPPEELKRDFDYLLSIYNSIISHSASAKAPALIYQESNLVIRSIRDYFSPAIDEVLIDDRNVFQEARDFFKAVMPEYASLVKLHQERRPIFARYQIEEQISQLSSNTVTLPSGGSIVLDQTEALVAIDVNSGKMSSEQDVEATAHRVNVEASTEIARQLRLRDMGGLIVIDYIDMRQRKNAREVEKTLKNALKIDKARVTVGRISHQFGLLEMSRQRIKANLGEGSYHQCQHCQGTGRIKGAESRSVSLLRRIQAGTAKGNVGTVSCVASLDVVNYILNHKRRELLDLEQRYKLKISITADPQFMPEQTELEFLKQSNDKQTADSNQNPLVDITVSERGTNDDNNGKSAVATEDVIGQNAEAPSSEADSAETEQTEVPEKKKPRRRRRPNRPRNNQKSVDEVTTVALSPEDGTAVTENSTPPNPEPATIETVPQEASTPTVPPTSAPPVSGETKLIATEPEAVDPKVAEVVAPDSTESLPDLGSTPELSAEKSEKSAPVKRRAPRRRAPKKVAQPDTETPAEALNDTLAQSSTETKVSATTENKSSKTITAETENSEEIKKPVRRRKAPAKKAPAPTSEPSASASANNNDIQELDATPANATEKPKRRAPRRTSSKKTAPTEEKSATVSATEAENSDSEPAVKKPVRRRTSKKTAPTEEKSATASATKTEDNENEPAVKKPVRRRTSKKTPEATINPDAEQPTAEEKPKRRKAATTSATKK
jgi:ribonuclease E